VTRYIVQRLLLLPFLLVVYSFVIFVIMQAPPGDFLTAYVATLSATGTSITADQIQALRHEYGLDQPFIVQYLYWVQNLLSGHLGLSLEYQRPNAELIGAQLGLTLALALMAFVLTWLIPEVPLRDRAFIPVGLEEGLEVPAPDRAPEPTRA